MRTPSSCAFFSFVPASSPATTRCVFLDTNPDTFPPRRSISAFASSRDRRASVPVSTSVLPANEPLASTCSGAGTTPAAKSRRTTAWFCGSEVQARISRAVSSPMSRTPVSSSSLAARKRSTSPK